MGEPGVGKTAIAEGLAQRIVAGDVPYKLQDKEVFLLDLTALVAAVALVAEALAAVVLLAAVGIVGVVEMVVAEGLVVGQRVFNLPRGVAAVVHRGVSILRVVVGRVVEGLQRGCLRSPERHVGHVGEAVFQVVYHAKLGMEGALASVVGGLVACPVIAVPTSVGYGASFGGLSALLSMLNSCASGVSVVNIDNGFGAGYIASMINRIGEE